MNNSQLNEILKEHKTVHFVGIGGISMSGLAMILLHRGYKVTGSDRSDSETLQMLSKAGVITFIGHNSGNLQFNCGLLVFTAAVNETNPEIALAMERNIPIISRAELLGLIMAEYTKSIAVSGMHGKTSVTSMISHILLETQKDPTILVGGHMPRIDSNYYVGHGDTIVCEACEYKDSFLKLIPSIAVVLNIEAEHLDYFKDLDAIMRSFTTFINGAECLVAGIDCKNVQKLCEKYAKPIMTFAIYNKSANVKAMNITYDEMGCPTFDVFENEVFATKITLTIAGEHNIQNALATFCVGRLLALKPNEIANSFTSFKNSNRRFQVMGKVNGYTVVDDYAHHPTEMLATFNAIKNMKFNRTICIFQPHTYTRTKALFNDFIDVLKIPNLLVLAPIYSAREPDIYGVSSLQLSQQIPNSKYFDTFEEIADYVRQIAKEGDLVLTMGAGEAYIVGEMLIEDVK